ncbi:MAG: VOC family protein [Steroidobacteraceae bacterium]|nr:VOC family protein [Steroidobacteraceae bacterium]MDW8260067.1 VOC family protein [Gammaproteobacteria bacterium]
MAILGIESLLYGVDDLDLCTRFFDDFGLNLVARTPDESVFEVASGSKVVLRKRGDPRLPTAFGDRPGVHETVWGVDSAAALERLAADQGRDRKLSHDPDGTVHFAADDGMPMALRVWKKRPVVSIADEVNTPGCIRRLNQHRQWRARARPKTINHVVFFVEDYVASLDFLVERLGFRYTDHSVGVGVFARADGTYEHHTIFLLDCKLPVAPGNKPGFMHAAFGVDDIDEVMIGANYMERKGWVNKSVNSSGGISRHRISSAIYYYQDCPAGGEAEYHADTDYLDDNWVPRAWDFKFGSLMWANRVPPIMAGDNIPWDMRFDPHGESLQPFRKSTRRKSAA